LLSLHRRHSRTPSRKTLRRPPGESKLLGTILFIGGNERCRLTLARITPRLDSFRLVVAEDVREARLLAVSLSPNLILLDSQLRASDAHEFVAYLERGTFTANMALAVSSGGEHESMDWLSHSIDPAAPPSAITNST
jgi:hypothetical protein